MTVGGVILALIAVYLLHVCAIRVDEDIDTFSCALTQPEYDALKDLYYFCNGPNWTWNESYAANEWVFPSLPSAPCDDRWQGVFCTVNCSIYKLELDGVGMNGTLPDSIGNLERMHYLFLSGNSLSGPLPLNISRMKFLKELVINENGFTSTFPDIFGNMRTLGALDASTNRFTGPFPTSVVSAVALITLNLAANSISGGLPYALTVLNFLTVLVLDDNFLQESLAPLCGLNKLQILSIAHNFLSGPFPTCVGAMTSLGRLNIGHNKFADPLTSVIDSLTVSSIYELDCGTNIFDGTIPSQLCALRGLQELYIDGNILRGYIPDCMDSMLSLAVFVVSVNGLSGPVPSTVGNISSLVALALDSNRLTGPLPTELNRLESLVNFDISFNSLSSSLPANFLNASSSVIYVSLESNLLSGALTIGGAHLVLAAFLAQDNYFQSSIPAVFGVAKDSLVNIDCARNFLSGTLPPEIGTLIALRGFDFGTNLLSGRIPDAYCGLNKLLQLNLNSNFLRGSIPNEIGLMTSLVTVLFYDNDDFGGRLPVSLRDLSYVADFDLSNTKVYGSIFDLISGWVYLSNLVMSNTGVSGTIASSIQYLTKLNELDLGATDIEGPIPTYIGVLQALEYLNLSLTGLQGTLPSEFGQLTNLEVVDLSEASGIEGTLPATINKLLKVNFMSLASNYFEGVVPSSLASFSGLQTLDISNNLLTGQLPINDNGLGDNLTYLACSNNLLTGSLPSAVTNYTVIQYLYVENNWLTGSLPQLSGKLGSGSLMVFDVADNLFCGSLSYSFWRIWNNLTSFIANGNLLTGTISSTLVSATRLENLDLAGNRFYGRLQDIFIITTSSLSNSMATSSNTSLLPAMLYLNMADNRFSGTLPAPLFQFATALQALDLSSNCLFGSIPSEICLATNLTTIVLNSLSSGGACKMITLPFFLEHLIKGIFPRSSMHGTLPSCLINLPKLVTLQLTGNGVTGAISDLLYPSSSNLTTLDFSYNQLNGNIPQSLQEYGRFVLLSLNNNKLSGELSSGFAVGSTTNLSLDLSINRLSGQIPAQCSSLVTVSIVTGNLMNCKGTNSIPVNDPGRKNYACASYQLDTALYVWLGCSAGITFVVVGLLMCCRVYEKQHERRRQNEMGLEQTQSSKLSNLCLKLVHKRDQVFKAMKVWYCVDLHASGCGANTIQFSATLLRAAWGIFITAVVYLSVCMFVYFGLKSNSSFAVITQQYGWTLTATFMHGYGPTSIIIAFLAVSCGSLFTFIRVNRLESTANIQSAGNERYKRILIQHLWKYPRLAYVFYYIALPVGIQLINVVVVLTANSIYVNAVHTVRADAIFLVQATMSLFKLIWVNGSIPLSSKVLKPYTTAEQLFRHQVILLLFNFLIGPGLATLGSSSNCFAEAIKGTAVTSSKFTVASAGLDCTARLIGRDVFYNSTDTAVISCVSESITSMSNSVPPFTYSYLCGSSFIVDYVPVWLYSYLASAVLMPFLRVALMHYDADDLKSLCYGLVHAWFVQDTVLDCADETICRVSQLDGSISSTLSAVPWTMNPISTTNKIVAQQSRSVLSTVYSGQSVQELSIVLGIGKASSRTELLDGSDALTAPHIVSEPVVSTNADSDVGAIVACPSSQTLSASASSVPRTTSNVSNYLTLRPSLRLTFTNRLSALTTASRSSNVNVTKDINAAEYHTRLFDGSMIIARRLVDLAMLFTFGLACPFVAMSIAISVLINGFTWKVMIGRYVTCFGSESYTARIRLERSCGDGILRGGIEGMWISLWTVSLFWSLIFYEMIADENGYINGIIVSSISFVGIPCLCYIVYMVRKYRWVHFSDRTTSLEAPRVESSESTVFRTNAEFNSVFTNL
jgi:Leucine-rich repeat (LRR) protein